MVLRDLRGVLRQGRYHDNEKQKTRSVIKNEINEMLKKEGPEAGEIPYQIVFSATKTAVDPRVTARKKAAAAEAAKPAEAKS